MFHDTYMACCKAAEGKLGLLKKNPLGYFVSSMLAGMFVAFGGMVSTVMSSMAADAGSTVPKLIAALLFSSALSLVIAAGSELFTGNNMVMAAGALEKRVSWGDVAYVWIVCWLGNLAGSILTVVFYQLSGAIAPVHAAAFAATALAKVSYTPVQMIFRGIFCNICVCLAVWCSIKLQNEVAKLIMSVWCILIFMICGFEHSVANMASILIGMLNAGDTVIPVLGYFKSLFFVSIGNILGGAAFVALPYWVISWEKKQ